MRAAGALFFCTCIESQLTAATLAACRVAAKWTSLAASADGTRLLAADAGGYLRVSPDGGKSWRECTGAPKQTLVAAMSADGTKLATIHAATPYVSANSGATWTAGQRLEAPPALNVVAVKISVDGRRLAAAVNGDHIYTSTDGGLKWAKQAGAGRRPWSDLAMSADGSRLLAAASPGFLYASANAGATWTQLTSLGANNWAGVAVAANGVTLFAVAQSAGFVYMSADAGWLGCCGPGQGRQGSAALPCSCRQAKPRCPALLPAGGAQAHCAATPHWLPCPALAAGSPAPLSCPAACGRAQPHCAAAPHCPPLHPRWPCRHHLAHAALLSLRRRQHFPAVSPHHRVGRWPQAGCSNQDHDCSLARDLHLCQPRRHLAAADRCRHARLAGRCDFC